MSPRTLSRLWLLAALSVFVSPRPAHAALDPSRAQADVESARREKAFTFCSEPRRPLSFRARSLCAHAKDIPGCEGFAKECAKSEARETPSWFVRMLRFLLDLLASTLARVLAWLFVGALLIAVFVPIGRALLRMRRDKALADPPDDEPSPRTAAVDVPATIDEDDLLGRAHSHALRGQNAIALQLYLAASLRALDKRGALQLAKDRTNGEYVRLCSDDGAKQGLRDIVREVDRVQFGREDATHDAVARAARRAEAIVRTLPVLWLVFALAALPGCRGTGGSRAWTSQAGDDPAGGELFEAVLRRQGLRTERLDRSLASLPLPGPDETAPAVVVDVERTQLDDDTRAHLFEWVEAGGALVLAGSPQGWPRELSMPAGTTSEPNAVYARGPFGRPVERGVLAREDALGLCAECKRVAWFSDGATYAAIARHKRGYMLGIASDELFTNAGLARPGNAAVMAAILSNVDTTEMRIAQPDDGVTPPSTPIAALTRAGLSLGLVHALVAALVLFIAVGVRLRRPQPASPSPPRAFAEHVTAVGALYANSRSAAHALAAYARFADERLHARMPRGANDVAAFLATRAHRPVAECRRVWARATEAKAGQQPVGDELAVLKELSAIYAAATAQDQ